MRIMVAVENRFLKTTNGNIYSTTVCDYTFFSRYLKVFDQVIVFARVSEIPEGDLDRPPASGPNVSFYSLPTFIGPWQFLRYYPRLASLAKDALTQADVFMLRVPSAVATLLWRCLKKRGASYSVEVIGDPWDGFAPGTTRSIVRPFVRRGMTGILVEQCRLATTAAYVTEYSLQKRYPPGCWSTHYSSIELPSDAIIDEQRMKVRLERIRAKAQSGETWRVGFVGSLLHLGKAPDILVAAVAGCIEKGLKLELDIGGDGSYRPELQKMAQNLGIADHVRFFGQLNPGKQVFNLMDQVDLYVLPSRQEGLPRSVIEAMARGLPCISSTVGGNIELLDEEFLVQPDHAKTLVSKIEAVFSNPKKMEEMAQRNLEVAKRYCADELNRRRTEHYRRLREITEARLTSAK